MRQDRLKLTEACEEKDLFNDLPLMLAWMPILGETLVSNSGNSERERAKIVFNHHYMKLWCVFEVECKFSVKFSF